MQFKNKEIIQYYENLEEAYFKNDNSTKYLPAKITFKILKNFKILKLLSEDIYLIRDKIIQHYGVPDPEDNNFFIISEDKKDIAQKELDDLIELEQEVNILMLKFSDIENLEFTMNQMEALMFMIEEDQVEA